MNTSFMIGCSSEDLQPGTVLYSNPSAGYLTNVPIRITDKNLDILKNATMEVTCKWYPSNDSQGLYINYNKYTIKLNNGVAEFKKTEYVDFVPGDDPTEIIYEFSFNIVNDNLTLQGFEYYSAEYYAPQTYGIAISEVKFINKG